MNETISPHKVDLPIEKKSDHNKKDGDLNISSSNIDIKQSSDNVKEKNNGKKYCFICNKRLKIMTTYDCRCGELFCASHRTPEYHNCTYDYSMHGQNVLSDKLQKIDHDKINKI